MSIGSMERKQDQISYEGGNDKNVNSKGSILTKNVTRNLQVDLE